MAGTQEGGRKAWMTRLNQVGSDHALIQAREAGRLGGRAKVKKGFAVSGKASEAGRKGGLTPKE